MNADKPDDTRTHETDFAAVWSSDGVTRSLSTAGMASLPMLVTADGAPAGRLRALARALIAWSPLIPWTLIATLSPEIQRTTPPVVFLQASILAILIAGAVWAWRHPSRGVQDRMAGTWIVPREQKIAS